MNQTAPTFTPETLQALEHQNRETVASWWTAADLLPHYPTDLETVVEVVTAAEYDVSRDLVLQYLQDKVIPTPSRAGGRMAWMATDIIGLATILESRRRWKKFSRWHDHKKNQFEKLTELAQLNGQASCFHDLDKWDIGGILALLPHEGCDLGARSAIAVVLKQKLKEKGIEV